MSKAFPSFQLDALDAWEQGALKPDGDGVGSVELRCHPMDEARCYCVAGSPVTRELLKPARCAFTAVAGAHSTFGWAGHVGAAYYESVFTPCLPSGSSFKRIDDAGHFCVMERPAAVAEVIGQVLWERGLVA